jgi:bifunctional non-homologous end joining protein LigD
MLASSDAPRPKDCVIEPKWDGFRSMVRVADGSVRVHSRHGHDVTDCYPELLTPPASVAGRSAVFDCEIIALDAQGRCSFQHLQQRGNIHRPSLQTVARTPVYLVVFDLLWLDGEALIRRPLSERRRILEELLAAPDHAWQLTSRLDGPVTDELLEMAREVGMEGLILKDEASIYRPGQRSKDWVKLKFRRTLLVTVGGRATDSSSLSVGVFCDGDLRYVGQVGMAMPRRTADTLDSFLATIRQDESPFVDLAKGSSVMFVEPLVVIEVSYTEVTAAGTLRQPIFVAVRPDVAADTVVADGELSALLAERSGPVRLRANQRL